MPQLLSICSYSTYMWGMVLEEGPGVLLQPLGLLHMPQLLSICSYAIYVGHGLEEGPGVLLQPVGLLHMPQLFSICSYTTYDVGHGH
jgi:hypothetical protein